MENEYRVLSDCEGNRIYGVTLAMRHSYHLQAKWSKGDEHPAYTPARSKERKERIGSAFI